MKKRKQVKKYLDLIHNNKLYIDAFEKRFFLLMMGNFKRESSQLMAIERIHEILTGLMRTVETVKENPAKIFLYKNSDDWFVEGFYKQYMKGNIQW